MSGLVFAAIVPHGHLAIPEACTGAERDLAHPTKAAMAELGSRFAAARPDVTIILTPHNVHVEGEMAVITAGHMAGTLSEWTPAPVALTCPVDFDLARATRAALKDAGIPTAGISYGGNNAATATAPMDWGVLIPLWYFGGRAEPQVPIVVVSPARDRSLHDHVRAGEVLAQVAAASGKRVALIASADHGHGHDANSHYGFDPASPEYDNQVMELIRDNNLGALLDYDPAWVSARAKADSFWQMLMLHGAIGDRWQVELLSYEAPTYFGMACAAYTPVIPA